MSNPSSIQQKSIHQIPVNVFVFPVYKHQYLGLFPAKASKTYISIYTPVFTARRYASAVYAVIVCPSDVRRSQVDVLHKRLNLIGTGRHCSMYDM